MYLNYSTNYSLRIEKDCTTWAHDRIRSLLTTTISTPLLITKVNGIEGEVSVNQRKGKVKQLFDLEINFEYKLDDASTGTGFISEFTADYSDPTDLNLKLTPRIDSQAHGLLLKVIGAVVEAFKAELFEVHGKPLLLEAESANAANNAASSMGSTLASVPSVNVSTSSNIATSSTTTPSTKTSTVTITDEVSFPCPRDQLYLMLTDPARIRSWSNSNPNAIPQILLPHAPFTLFDGNIICKLLVLQPPAQIEMEWRLKAWMNSSSVVISIEEEDACRSVLKITQSGVPRGEAETVKANWHNYYWAPIKRAFGVLQ